MERISLAGLDLNLILVLDRLLERRSVTAASADLGLSQPATSRALGRLRDALDDPILVRVGRQMVPTPRALQLATPARDALDAARLVFTPPDAFDPSTARGHVSLAIGEEVQHAIVPALLAAMAARCPRVDLRCRSLSAQTVEQGRRGEIDLAVSPDLSPLPDIAGAPDISEYATRFLYTRQFVVAARRGAYSAAPDLDAFCRAGHVIVSFDGGGRGFVDELLESHGRSRRVAAAVTSFTAAARIVAATDLLATVPAEVADDPALDAWTPPIPLPDLRILLLWHARDTRDPRSRFFRDLVADVVRARATAWAPPAPDCFVRS